MRRVLFIDEYRFTLVLNDGKQRVWLRPEELLAKKHDSMAAALWCPGRTLHLWQDPSSSRSWHSGWHQVQKRGCEYPHHARLYRLRVHVPCCRMSHSVVFAWKSTSRGRSKISGLAGLSRAPDLLSEISWDPAVRLTTHIQQRWNSSFSSRSRSGWPFLTRH